MMNIYNKILLSTMGISVILPACTSKTIDKSPNIIFILADDLGWMDLTCYGSKFYETPNIDKLAQEGMRFTNAYAACPVSSPSRVSFQTGKYPARVHITDFIPGSYARYKERIDTYCQVIPPSFVQNMPLEEITIAEALKKGGYQTAHIGKWNCSVDSIFYPQYQGYEINVAGCNKGGPGKDGYFSPYNNPYLKDGPKGEYLTDRLGTECIEIIRKFKDRPFFINLPFYQVHTPLLAKKDKEEYFKKKAHEMGLDTLQVLNANPGWKQKLPYSDNTLMERTVQSHAAYAAMIASMDENIGRIIDELKRLRLYENTIIIFTSDNGGLATSEGTPTTNAPLKGGKGHIYEGGIREPLIVKWKGLKEKGSVCDAPVAGTDFYPTILQLAGLPLKPEQHMDGVSFLPVLKGEKSESRYPLYWHFPHYSNQGGRPAGAVRMGDFKLIEFYDTNEIELYNLKDDISETNNLTRKKPIFTKKLLHMLHQWRQTVDAAMPVKNKQVQ